MVMFGYFVTLSMLFDDITIKFHLRGGSKKTMADMYEMSTKALRLTFNGTLKLSGGFDRIYISEKMVTVEIKIGLKDGAIGHLVDEMRGKDIRVEASIDLLAEKAKPVNRKFLSMCTGRVKKFMDYTGYSFEEMKMILNEQYSDLCDVNFNMDIAKSDELESFYSYLGQLLRGKGEDIPERTGQSGGVDHFLSEQRKSKKCCQCGDHMVEIVSRFPLCKKHLDEFNIMKTTYPKSYLKRYAAKHKF